MESRPILKLAKTSFQIWMNRLSLIIIGISTIYLVLNYNKLPDEVPVHFNYLGEADNWGPKWTIFILWGIALILFYVISRTEAFPHKYNYMVKITESNAVKQYKLAIKTMASLKFELMFLMSYLIWSVVQNSTDTAAQLNNIVMIIFVMCIISTVIISIVQSRKHR